MINEGIVKINSKMLEPSELKRLEKQEKENITMTAATVKGKTKNRLFPLHLIFKNGKKGVRLITSSPRSNGKQNI